MKERVAVILGPTATGKSHCAIELAKRLNGEIISGDSMYVYKGMDIGTAKPTEEELASAPHHLVDILPADAKFDVVDFKERAEQLIKEICKHKRGNDNLDAIAEELADVEIMCEQLRFIFGFEYRVDEWKKMKLNRLKSTLN